MNHTNMDATQAGVQRWLCSGATSCRYRHGGRDIVLAITTRQNTLASQNRNTPVGHST